MKSVSLWLVNYGPAALLVSLAVALFRVRYLEGPLRYAGLFVGLAVLGEAVSQLTGRLNIHNLAILHGYTLLEFNIIALFYGSFFGSFYGRSFVPWLMGGFTLLAILNTIFLQPLNGGNSNVRGLEAMIVIALALLCFYKILTDLATRRLDKHPIFWINAGFLLYFAGSLFFLILSNTIFTATDRTLTLVVFGLHVLLMVMMHLLIGVGLWFSPKLRATYTY